MKIELKKTILFIILALLTCVIHGQEKYEINLAKNPNGVVEQTIDFKDKLLITITNKLPKAEYDISIERKIKIADELKLDRDTDGQPKPKMESANSPCVEFLNNIEAIDTVGTEKGLSKLIKKITRDLTKLDGPGNQIPPNLKSCTQEHKEKALDAMNMTVYQLMPQKLKQGEDIEVTISRKSFNENEDKIVWKYVFTTQKRGKWLTTYGFTYVPTVFKKSEPFFAQQTDTVFTVTPLNKRSRLLFVPSIFFTWFPYKDIGKNWSPSFTGGIGYDLEAPTAFIGGNLLYNQNIGISMGLAAHQQDFLNGRYEDGQILKENLGENQLLEKLYTFNPYISVTFRFGAATFKNSDTASATETED